MFVSPDGGETVYEQLPNGKRKLVSQSQLAKRIVLLKTVLPAVYRRLCAFKGVIK
jgi:hypothetical protein